jgi:hypothetical protein
MSSERSIADPSRRVAAKPLIRRAVLTVLLLFAAKYQPAVIYAPQKSWQLPQGGAGKNSGDAGRYWLLSFAVLVT